MKNLPPVIYIPAICAMANTVWAISGAAELRSSGWAGWFVFTFTMLPTFALLSMALFARGSFGYSIWGPSLYRRANYRIDVKPYGGNYDEAIFFCEGNRLRTTVEGSSDSEWRRFSFYSAGDLAVFKLGYRGELRELDGLSDDEY